MYTCMHTCMWCSAYQCMHLEGQRSKSAGFLYHSIFIFWERISHGDSVYTKLAALQSGGILMLNFKPWTNNGGAYLTHQSGSVFEVLPASLSSYLLQDMTDLSSPVLRTPAQGLGCLSPRDFSQCNAAIFVTGPFSISLAFWLLYWFHWSPLPSVCPLWTWPR